MHNYLTRSRNRFYISAAAAPTHAERIAAAEKVLAEANRALETARIAAVVARRNAINTVAAGAAIRPEEVWLAQRLAYDAERRAQEATMQAHEADLDFMRAHINSIDRYGNSR